MKIGSERIIIGVVVLSLLALAAAIYGIVSAGNSGENVLPFGLAYSSTQGLQTKLYVINRDGSIDQITQGEGQDTGANWSPDGKRLAFVRDNDIYIHDDSGDHRITANGGASSPHWSPDGKQIAYSSQQASTSKVGFLWLMDKTGENQHPVFAEDGPNKLPQDCFGGFVGGWYPDSDRIIYRGSFPDGSISICSVKPDGTGVQVLIHDASGVKRAEAPALSADGTKLAYVELLSGKSTIYIADPDGSNPRKLLDETGNQDFPQWSPDGQWIAYTANSTGPAKLYMVHPDGTGAVEVSVEIVGASFPAWRPN